uniref:hypothetical protein n=1 Tax=Yoonia sp. TaxID=2212373 RepID=UPI004048125F
PKTLLFGTGEKRRIFGRQKPGSKPKQLLKVFGSHLKADFSCIAVTWQSGLQADIANGEKARDGVRAFGG